MTESWRVGDAGHTIFGPKNGTPSPETIASVRKGDNARRIVACVNACAGIPTDVLNGGFIEKLIAKLEEG